MLSPDDRVVVYMRPGCHVCARVKGFLTDRNLPYETRDVDRDPLTPRELWDLFNRKANRLRVPFTALNDGEDVVLGFDPQRLEGVFVHGELGGVQVSTPVQESAGYDAFTTARLDETLWAPASTDLANGSTGRPDNDRHAETGDGRLRLTGPARYVSTRRFGTPPGSQVSFGLDLAVETDPDAVEPLGPPLAELGVLDLPTGAALGFEVTGGAILAVHRRCGPPGVSAEAEHFAHRVITDVDTKSGQRHRYRISYRHDSGEARWYVDGRCEYAAITPVQIEGVSLGMALVGGPGAATWGSWQFATDG